MTAQVPASPDAEAAVLGSLILDSNGMSEIATLQASDFYAERNGRIFQVIGDLAARGRVVDYVTLVDWLESQHLLSAVGGAAYITQLVNAVPSSVYIGHYGGIVERYSRRRKLIAAATQIVSMAYDTAQDDADVEAKSRVALEGALYMAHGTDLLTWSASFDAFANWQLLDAAERAENRPTLTLPWRTLSFVRALQGGSFGIVGAESGVGKSIFMECCAEVWARRGFQVAFFHTELMHKDMLKRRMCRWAGMTMFEVDGMGLTEAMQQADTLARAWPGAVNYVSCAGWRAGQIVSRAHTMRQQGQADVVILDYLQDLAMTEYVKGQNPADMRGGDAKLLKAFAERDNVALLAGSQFNRVKPTDGGKTRSNLRDSAVYDQKASLVILLDRPILKTPFFVEGKRVADVGEQSPETTVKVDKQTFGRTGNAQLWTEAKRFLMTDIERGKQ